MYSCVCFATDLVIVFVTDFVIFYVQDLTKFWRNYAEIKTNNLKSPLDSM